MATIYSPTKKARLKDYLLLGASDEHPELLVNMNRLGLRDARPFLDKLIRLTLAQDAKEYIDVTNSDTLYYILLNRAKNQGYSKLDPAGFLGFLEYDEADKLLRTMNRSMITVPHFVEFLIALRSDKAYGGNGKVIRSDRLNRTLKDIMEQKDPWRGEWLNQRCIEKQGRLYVVHNEIKSNGKIEQAEELLDEETLMTGRTPGISLEDMLKGNRTRQGLPTRKIESGNVWYFRPVKDSVAWFNSNSDGVELDCNGDPRNGDSALGVRDEVAHENFE